MIVQINNSPGWKHFQARALEWFNAFVLFGFGLYLSLHANMFIDPRISLIWSGLAAVAAQATWGTITIIVGFLRLTALYINGRHHRTPTIRLATSFVSAFVWTQVVLGMWNAGVPNTGLVVYTTMILADIYSAFRASSDMTMIARSGSRQDESSVTYPRAGY